MCRRGAAILIKASLGRLTRAVNYKRGHDRERHRDTEGVRTETKCDRERWERKSKWGWRGAELQQPEEDCEPYYCRVNFESVYICVCAWMDVCAHVTSGVLAYRSMVLSCASTCICVCLSSRPPVPEAPDSDQSVWALTDPPLGLGSKRCLWWTLNTSWRKYFYQCFF